MNITRENIDELNAVIKLKIEKADYQESVNTVLKDHRKKAQMPGFRPGKVPASLIKKMYGQAVLADEINKMISEKLMGFIAEEKLEILGEPLPSDSQEQIDFENQEDFEFSFDIGISPEVDIKLSKDITIPYYQILANTEMVEGQMDQHRFRFGANADREVVESGEEMIYGDFTQVDAEGSAGDDPVIIVDKPISLKYFKNEEQKALFNEAKLDQTIIFNPMKAFENESEVAALLAVPKEDEATMNSDFQIQVKKISEFVKAELNEEFFTKFAADGSVTSEDEFKAKVTDEIKTSFGPQSDFRFLYDIKDHLIENSDFELPEQFLKRWMMATDKKEELSEEKLNEDFPKIKKELKWQVLQSKLLQENSIKIEEEDLLEAAKQIARSQFAQYGIMEISDEDAANYGKEVLKNDEQRRRLTDQKLDEKLGDALKELVTLKDQDISVDDFNKLFEAEKNN